MLPLLWTPLQQYDLGIGCDQQDLKALDPEKLNERLDDLDEYMKEMNCITERALDEDVDDYLAEIDDSIAQDNQTALPEVPTTIPKAAAAPSEEKTERVAVME